MSDPSEFIVWPLADGRIMALAIGLGMCALAVAVFMDLWRRRRENQHLYEAELRSVRDLFDEREVRGEDRSLMFAIISQYEPKHPGRAVARRHVFDACMQRYFQTLAATADPSTIAQRGAQLRDVRSRLGLDYVPLGQRILSTRELYDGQVLWASPASGHEPRWFQLKTVKVDEACFYIVPVGKDDAPSFQPGDMIKFRLWREDDARYLFEARIFQVDRDPILWRVMHADTLTRTQARAHYRIRFDATVQVSILNAPPGDNVDGLDTSEAVTQLYGRITSLSGGGLAIHFQQPMPKQMLMRVPLQLPGSDRIIAAFVRPTGAQNVGGGRSVVRGKFVAMDDDTRDAITRYIFLKQKHSASDDTYLV